MEHRETSEQFSCTCKVIYDRDELPRSHKQWTRAKRCTLTLEDRGLSYGDRFISYIDIHHARLHIYPSAFFFEYGILSITTPKGTDHFGIKYSPEWQGDLPFAVERVKEETPFILFRRIVMLCIIIYIFWEVVRH